MSITILLAEPDIELATAIKGQLETNSVDHCVLHDSKHWVSLVQDKKFSHVILNYELEKDITDLLLTKLELDHGHPKIILVVSEKQRPFIKKSILENQNICQILPFPYTFKQVLNCIEEKKGGGLQRFLTAKSLTTKVIEEIYTKGFNEHNITYAQKIAESISLMVQKDRDFSEVMKGFDDYKPIAYTHPFLVCVFSMLICKKLTWDSPRTLSAVAFGSLIHDVGLTALDPKLQTKNPQHMTEAEVKVYQTHPVEGMRLASLHNQIPSAVLQIILQHHEANGKGFPGAIPGQKIYPLAKVVSLSDRFARYLMDHELPVFVGLKKFLSDRAEIAQHEPEMIKALIKSFIKDEKESA